ncbi:MAG: DUF6152 family protein [Candidatus Dactylopiibacterium sp.]|nr:DUF6152 family protein [Candidatus Dactylopiibacterium sp.]
MLRRDFLVGLPLLLATPRTLAHHGWSSFDDTRPLYLEGVASDVRWRNPHVEFFLDLSAGQTLPAGLATHSAPAQSAQVDAAAILARAELPRRKDRRWQIELAPLTRLTQWKVSPLRAGEEVAVVGYTFAREEGAAILRAEFLIRRGELTPMRSGPA